jgi:hypothetical protein
VVIDWTLALFLKREVVSLGELHQPREPFTEVTPEVRAKAADTVRALGDLPDVDVGDPLRLRAEQVGDRLPERSVVALRGQDEAAGAPEPRVLAAAARSVSVIAAPARCRRPRRAAATSDAGTRRARPAVAPVGPDEQALRQGEPAPVGSGPAHALGAPRLRRRNRDDHPAATAAAPPQDRFVK